jgi:hypothetical protein
MGYYSSIGYWLIGLSPVLALILYLSMTLPSVGALVFVGVPFQWFLIGVAVPTIGVEMIGFVLYVFGGWKKESMPFSLGVTIFLFLWGILVMFYAGVIYGDLLNWAELAHFTVTIQSNPEIMNYIAIAVMGALWFGWGIALTVVHWLSLEVKS